MSFYRRLMLCLCLSTLASCSRGAVEGDLTPVANTVVSDQDFDAVFEYLQSRMPSDGSELVRFGGFELRLSGDASIRFRNNGHTTAMLRRGEGLVSLVKSREGNIKSRNAAYAAFQELLAASKRPNQDSAVP